MLQAQRTKLVLIVMLISIVAVAPLDAQSNRVLYGAIGDNLVRINPVTGRAGLVAPFSLPPSVDSISDLAFDENSGTLYGLKQSPPVLVTIDPCTAGVTSLGAVTVPGRTVYFAEGFAIDPSGTLYVSMSLNGSVPSGDFFSETLGTLDPLTAQGTVQAIISGTVQQEADGLEFAGSTLFAIDDPGRGPANIYTVDLLSGAATFVGATASPRFNNPGDLAYNPDTQLLYGVDPGVFDSDNPRRLGLLDQNTAQMTVIGEVHTASEFGGASLAGLSWANVSCSGGSGPITSSVQATPNPASTSDSIVLFAALDDTATPGSTVFAANYEIRDAEGTVVLDGSGDNGTCPLLSSLCPVDEADLPEPAPTPYDSATEDVRVIFPPESLVPGVYDVCVQGTGVFGDVGAFACTMLVAYDPEGGSVTGGGWIQSDSGFCHLDAACEAADGRANFGFVSKYKKGTHVPTGQTQFRFSAGGLNFHSDSYDWLVVAGSMAQFKGSGTINGTGDYGFLLTAKDSKQNSGPSEDTFRIKIWDKAGETIVYDNGSNQPLGGGSIKIQK